MNQWPERGRNYSSFLYTGTASLVGRYEVLLKTYYILETPSNAWKQTLYILILSWQGFSNNIKHLTTYLLLPFQCMGNYLGRIRQSSSSSKNNFSSSFFFMKEFFSDLASLVREPSNKTTSLGR
jgi:hypothetical protein